MKKTRFFDSISFYLLAEWGGGMWWRHFRLIDGEKKGWFDGEKKFTSGYGPVSGIVFAAKKSAGVQKRETHSLFARHSTSLISLQLRDGKVKFWDPATGTLQHTIEESDCSSSLLAISSDDNVLAICNNLERYNLWNLTSDIVQQTFESCMADSMTFSPNGKLLASAEDDTVNVWNISTRNLQQYSCSVRHLHVDFSCSQH